MFLGTCANQTAEKESVSFIVEAGGNNILVETGPGVVRQVYRSGHKFSNLPTILVTHSHADHSCGFPYAIWSNFYERLEGGTGSEEIRVLGITSVVQGLDKMLRFCYNIDTFPFRVVYSELTSGQKTRVGEEGPYISSVPVIHTTPNIGIRIDFEGKSVCYSSDTLFAPEFVELAEGCDLMIHEAFVDASKIALSNRTKHGTAMDAGRSAQQARAKKLALVHLYPPYVGKEGVLVDEAKQYFNGNIFVPDELERIIVE